MTTEQAIETLEQRHSWLAGGQGPERQEEAAALLMGIEALRAQQDPHICPLLSDVDVKQPCTEGPRPAYMQNQPLTMEQLREGAGVGAVETLTIAREAAVEPPEATP